MSDNAPRKIKLAYLVTHPIQYQAPLLKLIAQRDDIELKVFFQSKLSVSDYIDEGFGKKIQWDVPLLEGYDYEFLPALGDNKKISFFKPFNFGLFKRLKKGKFDVLWIHGYARWFHWMAILSAKILGIKVLMRDEATNVSTPRSPFKQKLKRVFFFVLNKFVDGYLAIGSMNRQYYLDLGIKERKVFSMPYVVDNDFFQEKAKNAEQHKNELKQSLGIEPNQKVILFASKLSKRKYALLLLEAYIKLYQDVPIGERPCLVIIGDGEEKEQLQQKINRLNWNSVKYLGFKNQTELPAYYNLADVFVLPSYYEPWGLVINEAMNAGCAIVASCEVGAAGDLVKDNYNGMTFKPNNLDSLVNALNITLQNSREMGENSLELISNWGFDRAVVGLLQAAAEINEHTHG